MEKERKSVLDGIRSCLLPDPEKVGIYLWTGDQSIGVKTLDRITGLIEYGMKKDPYNGDLYVFRNKAGYELFVYWWSGDSWCEWKKRNIKYRTYPWPKTQDSTSLKISAAELHLMLKRINIWNTKM